MVAYSRIEETTIPEFELIINIKQEPRIQQIQEYKPRNITKEIEDNHEVKPLKQEPLDTYNDTADLLDIIQEQLGTQSLTNEDHELVTESQISISTGYPTRTTHSKFEPKRTQNERG